MSVPMMIAHLLLERLARHPLPRIPETDAVMAAADQIDAFNESGRDDGMLTHLYFLHALMSLPVIRPGDTVLDLACGPANQLAHVARLHPRTHFIGVDASPRMLELARDTLAALPNTTLQIGDITNLQTIAPASIDSVMCTMSLHHLPNVTALDRVMREIRRVLKPGGGIYLADFGRLKRAASQHYFAHDRAGEQSPVFTTDFLQSMRAAFSVDELKNATALLGEPLSLHTTALAPFVMIFRSNTRRAMDNAIAVQVGKHYRELSRLQRRDLNNLARWFRIGGVALPINPDDGESAQR